MKTKLITFHIIILLILGVNLFIIDGYNFGLNSYAKITLLILFFESGISMFALNVKPVFKLWVRLYSTFYMTVALLVMFMFFSSDKPFTHLFPYEYYDILSKHIPIYSQSNYELYEYMRPSIFNTPNGGCSNSFDTEYYLDKNYFIFKTRVGYFDTNYSVKYTNAENPLEFTMHDLVKKDIKNISVANDSIFINFYEDENIAFEIEE